MIALALLSAKKFQGKGQSSVNENTAKVPVMVGIEYSSYIVKQSSNNHIISPGS